MVTRRNLLKLGAAASGASLALGKDASADTQLEQARTFTKFLCPPDDRPHDLGTIPPSPPATPFKCPLFVPPVMDPVPALDPPPDPNAHQRYHEFEPQKLYEIYEREFKWKFHCDPPYDKGSYTWGFGNTPDGAASTPGPTYVAHYGQPVLTRRFNNLPTVGNAKVQFALPSTTSHLHNGHTASESDGNPQDWIDSGEFWDHQYGNFPSGFDPREKLTTLWYHDHRLDFTAANVYAGLAGFYLLFDDEDTGDENTGFRLPSFPDYDVPLLLQDILFDEDGGVIFDNFATDGMLGDQLTVNRIIRPYMEVEPRKYRLRFLNGGPSRFYQLFLKASRKVDGTDQPPFCVLTGDGNFLPAPVTAESIYLSVAQRVDVILDFSKYEEGDTVVVHNLLDQTNGRGPSGRLLDFDDPDSLLLQFRVGSKKGVVDNSRIPKKLRELPTINFDEVKQERLWVFDYDGGLWTINGKVMDPNRIDAGIEQGSAEIWTFRNGGNDWAHPIHSHFTEFLILEINGKPFKPSYIQDVYNNNYSYIEYLALPEEERRKRPIKVFMGGPRRDVATILPGDELKLFMRWKDFLGKHVMHCHNVVHEDHAMMIRWDIVEPGRGFSGSRKADEFYDGKPPFPDPRPPAPPHVENRPKNPTIQDG